MASSGPTAAAALAAPGPVAAASALPPRPLPYFVAPLRRHRAPPLGQPSPATAPAASAPTAAMWTTSAHSTTSSRVILTHGSLTAGAGRLPLPLPPGLPTGPTPRGHAVLTRYFREGGSLGGAGGEVPPPPLPPPPPPASPSPAGSGAGPQGTDPTAAAATGASRSPQGNAVPFVPSTRLRHHEQHHAAAAAASAAAVSQREALAAAAARRRAGWGSEEDEAYAGADEDIRWRSHALREAMFLEAEQRAVGTHPDILVEDLAAEATVPYDAAGALEPPPARGDEGEAAGPPSGGAGPHAGLAVESVDPDTGGFTASYPAVDPAYDDVGRAIRREQGRRHHHHPSLTPMVAEVRARKAATAEDLREVLLDAAPELQDTYRTFGLPAGGRLTGHRSGAGGGAGEVTASDEELEELLEMASFGADGAVLAAEGEEPPASTSALTDPLGLAAGSAAASAVDPLAALDALEHREVLDLLESGATGVATGGADISNVMPSPLLAAPAAPADPSSGRRSSSSRHAAASAAAGRARSSSSGGGGSARRRLTVPAAVRRDVRGAGAGAAASGTRHAAPLPADSGYPAVYHTSPDVPDADLQLRRQRRRLARRLVRSASTAAAAARKVRGSVRPPAGGGRPATALERPAGPDGGAAAAAGGVAGHGRAGWVLQAPLYNTSPDVPDEELGRAAAAPEEPRPGVDAVAAAAAATDSPRAPPERPQGGGGGDDTKTKAEQSTPKAGARPVRAAAAAMPPPPARAGGDGQRLRSLGDVDRQFIDIDSVNGWDEQAHDLRSAMRSTLPKPGRSTQPRAATQPPGARGAHSSLQPQTIGIHGDAAGSAAAAATAATAAAAATASTGAGTAAVGGATAAAVGDGRAVTVLKVECVPSQTYGVARTAAVLAADGQLRLLARPKGPSPERVRAALKLLRMAPDSRDFRAAASEAAAAAADNDELAAAATEAAAVAAAMAAVGTPGMEMEAELRPAPPLPPPQPSVEERDLQLGLLLGQTEIDPAEVMADPNFPLESSWSDPHDHHDPHDPHATPPMADSEGHMLSMQDRTWNEDYDEVMGQIYDGQRSGWSEDAVNGGFDSDVY